MRSCIKKIIVAFLCLCAAFPFAALTSTATGDDVNNFVYIDSQAFESASEIEVPVYIGNNTGFAGCWLEFEYDTDVLTPVSVRKGIVLESQNGIFENSIGGSVKDRLIVTWASGENIVDSGELFVIVFRVDPSADGDYPIDISYSKRNTFAEDYSDVVFHCSGSVLTLSNEQYGSSARIGAGNISAVSGSTASVPVLMFNNNGLSSAVVTLLFDSSAMSVSSVAGANATCRILSLNNEAGSLELLVSNGGEPFENGTLFEVVFLLDEEAAGTYTIGLQCSEDIIVQSGSVEVEDPDAALTTMICGDDICVEPEETIFTVPVRIKYNHGIMGYKIDLHYDSSVLIPMQVSAGTDFSQGVFEHNIDESGSVYTVWAGSSEVKTDGDLFYVIFQILPNRPATTVITMDYSSEDTFDGSYNNVEIETEDITLSFVSSIISPKGNSGAVVSSGYIFGLDAGGYLADYVVVSDGYTAVYPPASVATGQILRVYSGDSLVREYTVILFGDVNGDGWYNGTDAFFVSLIANALIPDADFTDAQRMAADCNHDGAIDDADVALLEQAGLLITQIDQTLPQEALGTNSVYIEYCSIIDQNYETVEPSVDESQVSEHSPQTMTTVRPFILVLFRRLLDFIAMLFSFIIMPG